MATSSLPSPALTVGGAVAASSRTAAPPAWTFAAAFVTVAAAACLLAGWAPLGFSIVTVLLFAGPHNWMEARYFMSRMPARWGRLWVFFALGIGGVVLLSASSVLLPSAGRIWQWEDGDWLIGVAVWNTLFVLWILSLVELRRRERREPAWRWAMPVGLALVSANWLWPMAWSLGLVYLHPLVALWFLDRELRRRRAAWHRVYRRCLLLVPLLLVALWWRLADAPNLPGDDMLSLQIAHHAGAGIIDGVSTQLLVATHTFLEMLHYIVWIVAIPLLTYGLGAWRIDRVPLAIRSRRWRPALAMVLLLGAVAVVALWAGFLANYPLTRDIYFGVAIVHVLAEVPFLLRLL